MNDEMFKQALFSAMRGDHSGNAGGDDEMFITSIKDANILLKLHMDPNGACYRKQLVDYITDPENRVFSEADVYHNLIMDLFRSGDHDAAIKVCDFALDRAPKNMDLLADAIKACGDSSQFDLGETYLAKANDIPRKHWSWRMFLYGVDFLHTKLKAYPDSEELFTRAYNLAKEYVQFFPTDEHGYNQQAEILISVNRRADAMNDLYRFITERQGNATLICAQCCVTLLNLLDESNDYDRIIEICDKGMCNTAQEQPSASLGFFVYRKALALDAKAHNNGFRSETLKEAMAYYQAAYDLNQGRQYVETIEQRYALLRIHTEKDKFVPLVKRSLCVEET